ncbi:MAG TPA: hypothetical protein VJS30_06490 [Paraburkholderia sp.]|nr:hypothetical protein [Paraburkholderia sp.]
MSALLACWAPHAGPLAVIGAWARLAESGADVSAHPRMPAGKHRDHPRPALIEIVEFEAVDQYQLMVEDFASVLNGKRRELVFPLESSLGNQLVIDKILASSDGRVPHALHESPATRQSS